MTSVARDQNRIPIWFGLSSVDGTTLVPIQIDLATGGTMMEFGTSTMAVMSNIPSTLPRDENRVTCIAGQSSTSASVFIPVSVNPTNGAIQAQIT